MEPREDYYEDEAPLVARAKAAIATNMSLTARARMASEHILPLDTRVRDIWLQTLPTKLRAKLHTGQDIYNEARALEMENLRKHIFSDSFTNLPDEEQPRHRVAFEDDLKADFSSEDYSPYKTDSNPPAYFQQEILTEVPLSLRMKNIELKIKRLLRGVNDARKESLWLDSFYSDVIHYRATKALLDGFPSLPEQTNPPAKQPATQCPLCHERQDSSTRYHQSAIPDNALLLEQKHELFNRLPLGVRADLALGKLPRVDRDRSETPQIMSPTQMIDSFYKKEVNRPGFGCCLLRKEAKLTKSDIPNDNFPLGGDAKVLCSRCGQNERQRQADREQRLGDELPPQGLEKRREDYQIKYTPPAQIHQRTHADIIKEHEDYLANIKKHNNIPNSQKSEVKLSKENQQPNVSFEESTPDQDLGPKDRSYFSEIGDTMGSIHNRETVALFEDFGSGPTDTQLNSQVAHYQTHPRKDLAADLGVQSFSNWSNEKLGTNIPSSKNEFGEVPMGMIAPKGTDRESGVSNAINKNIMDDKTEVDKAPSTRQENDISIDDIGDDQNSKNNEQAVRNEVETGHRTHDSKGGNGTKSMSTYKDLKSKEGNSQEDIVKTSQETSERRTLSGDDISASERGFSEKERSEKNKNNSPEGSEKESEDDQDSDRSDIPEDIFTDGSFSTEESASDGW